MNVTCPRLLWIVEDALQPKSFIFSTGEKTSFEGLILGLPDNELVIGIAGDYG
jgi:hypothetical protein